MDRNRQINVNKTCLLDIQSAVDLSYLESVLQLRGIYVRKGKDGENSEILSFFFVTERTQLNAAYKHQLTET